MLSKDEFLRYLRDCLNHLYDPDYLRASPLAALLGLANRSDTPSALRRILTQGVEALEPPADEPLHSRAWRLYNALLYLYVQQMSQEDAADQMALSDRQLRRERTAGVRALGDLLWERFKPGERQAEAPVIPPTVSQELAWLRDSAAGEPADLAQVLHGLADLAQALAARHQARLEMDPAGDLPRVAVHPVALRQMLLSLLSLAVQRAAGGRVSLSAGAGDVHRKDAKTPRNIEESSSSRAFAPLRLGGESGAPSSDQVEVCVRGEPADPTAPLPPGEAGAGLSVARQLIELCRCRLDLPPAGAAFQAVLSLPLFAQVPVLVVDDNADTLQLLQRYSAGTPYRLVSTRDPEQALALAERHQVRAIVLDVMMPQVDGWEMLARLRQHAATEQIPVVVCTVLADEEMAFSLGASAFLRKPVTREAFLAALEQISRQA